MKFFTNLLLLALGIAYVAAAPTKKEILSTASRLTTAQLLDLRRRVQGCNANVCFAIDGSASIDKENFEAQKNFILDVTAVIADGTNPVELAAVQYGTSTSAISRLTLDPERFNTAVVNTPQLRSDSTFVAGGISFCFGQLFRRRNEANKIVLLGIGKSTIGASAVARADLFRRYKGQVCTVGLLMAVSYGQLLEEILRECSKLTTSLMCLTYNSLSRILFSTSAHIKM